MIGIHVSPCTSHYSTFCTHNQSTIVLLLLSSFLIHADIREYAVLALRHALEGNMANQAIIEELRPVGAAQHPVLEEMGLRTDLDPVTGQPRISRKEMP